MIRKTSQSPSFTRAVSKKVPKRHEVDCRSGEHRKVVTRGHAQKWQQEQSGWRHRSPAGLRITFEMEEPRKAPYLQQHGTESSPPTS